MQQPVQQARSWWRAMILLLLRARSSSRQAAADISASPGASVNRSRPGDGGSLGIRPAERDYSAMVRTANGAIRVAPVALDTVEIEDLEVHNVAAVVLPAGVANENLLGL